MHDGREYIGLVESKELPNYGHRAMNNWYDYVCRTYMRDKWRQNYSTFFRYDDKSSYWNSYAPSYARTDYVPLTINQSKSIIKSVINMTYSQMPVFASRSSNTDPKSQDHVDINNLLLEHDTKEGFIQRDAIPSGYNAYIFGMSFDLMDWNENGGESTDIGSEDVMFSGDISSDVLTVLDVYFDCTKKRWEDLDWIIVRQKVNKFKLASNPKYRQFADRIMSMKLNEYSVVPYFFDYTYDVTDDIFIYKFIHKPDPIMLPQGRYAIYTGNDLVLEDGPNPYYNLNGGQLNVFPLTPNEHVYGVYGDTDCNDMVPVQKLHDALTSCLMTKVTAFGIDKLFVEDGSLNDIESLTGGLKLFKMKPGTTDFPKNIDMMGDLSKIMSPLPFVEKSLESLAGMNAAARGMPDPSIKAAVAMSYLQSMARQYNTTFQRRAFEQMRQKAQFALELRKKFAKEKQVLKIVGSDKKFKLKRWTADSISMVDTITVEPVDPVTDTIGGRIAFSEKLAQMGAPIPDYVRALKQGDYSPIMDESDSEYNNIALENAKILRGEVPMAIREDNHELHRRKHKIIMEDPDVRNDKKIMDAFNTHMEMHDQAEMMDAKHKASVQLNIKMTIDGMQQAMMPPPPQGMMGLPPGAPPGQGMPPPRNGGPPPNAPPPGNGLAPPASGGKQNPAGDMPFGTI
jgi:hypothetical protein